MQDQKRDFHYNIEAFTILVLNVNESKKKKRNFCFNSIHFSISDVVHLFVFKPINVISSVFRVKKVFRV